MGNDVFLSNTDRIPTKKVVSLLGEVYVKKKILFGENMEGCFKDLKKKALEMGANGVINAVYIPSGRGGLYAEAKGMAVKVVDDLGEDMKTSPSNDAQAKYCSKCGNRMALEAAYCSKCGQKLN